MRLRPRRACTLAFLALAVALLSTSAWAQLRGRTPRTSPTQTRNPERAKITQALTLLIETAAKARLFEDLFYRARVQVLAADALWPYDKQQARTIFRRAWAAATAADKATEENDDIPKELKFTDEARDFVLEKVAARDSQLAGEFLNDLSKENSEEQSSNPAPQSPHDAWRELSADGERRLGIASTLLRQGEAHRAAEIVAPVIKEGVNISLVEFILALRERDINDADTLYRQLIERAAADPRTDANDVLLLSSPVVSPYLLVNVDEFGALKFFALRPIAVDSSTQPIPQQLQTAFYNLAASILLRPMTPGDGALTMQELIATFYTTGRLLPFFENSSASYVAYAPALRARHSELFNEIEANRREQVSSQFGVSTLTRKGNVDPLRSQQEELSRSANATERERIALAMIKKAVQFRFWDRARRAASEIEDLNKRRAALSFIQVYQIKSLSRDYADEKEDDFESIVRFVHEADVPPFAKAWGLAQAAVVAARKRGPQATQTVAELIDEAESYAAHVEQGRLERVAAYAVVTVTASRFDQQRAWNLLGEYVKAANAVEDFTGDEASLDLATNNSSDDPAAEHFNIESEVFHLDGIFETMAHLDFDKALAEARSLDGDVPQAFATIAVAKSRIQKSVASSQKE